METNEAIKSLLELVKQQRESLDRLAHAITLTNERIDLLVAQVEILNRQTAPPLDLDKPCHL